MTKETIRIQENIGKAKYVVSWWDGIKKNKDGSNAEDIAIFKNKKKLNTFLKELQAK